MGKLRTLLATAAGSLTLAGCAQAGAEDNNNATPETAEFTKLAAVVETADEIKKRCRTLSHETEAQKRIKKACYEELSAIRQAEIAALDEKIEEGKTTNEVLTKLNEITQEEFEKETRPQN